jgi:hypothetical protein
MILLENKEKTLPTIIYEEINGTIHIKGRCVSLKIKKHFQKFFLYLKNYLLTNTTNINVHTDIEYFSIDASKMLMELFYILKQYIYDKNFSVDVYWYYEKDNEDILKCGKEYEELSHLNFHYIEKLK